MIQHIVLFNPKAETGESDRRSFARKTIDALTGSCEISRVTVGRRVDIDAGYARKFGDKTYTYAVVLEFPNRDGLVRYLNSEEHAEVGRLFWQHCDSTVVSEVEVVDVRATDAVERLVV